MPDTFVWIYHPQLGNRQAYVPLSSVDDHAARGWLLVDPGVTPPAPTVPYTTVAQVASQLSTGTGPIGVAGRAASVAAVEDATTVAPTGAWDFTQAPTVAGAPIGGGSGGAVDSVNGQTGAVTLNAADVGAQPAGSYAPAAHTHTASQVAGVMEAIGTAASPISDPNVARPAGAAVALFMMAAGVTPVNAVNGDWIWNA